MKAGWEVCTYNKNIINKCRDNLNNVFIELFLECSSNMAWFSNFFIIFKKSLSAVGRKH